MSGILLAGDGFSLNRKGQDHRPLTVILMGPPGAGKGTHAGPLSSFLSIPHISTGDLFRENIRNQTILGMKAKEYIDQGKLVPDELVFEMLFKRTLNEDCKEGYILDGFPRTEAQAKVLDQRIEKDHHLIVLNFNISDELLVERITARIACSQCNKPFHKKYDPPKKEGVCDSCGGLLYQRNDDKEEILRKRLEVYHRDTQPLIDYYAKKKDVLREIDGERSKEQVFHDVLEAFPQATALTK